MPWTIFQQYRFGSEGDQYCDFDPTRPHLDLAGSAKDMEIACDDWSYVYLGYFLENDQQGKSFLEAYDARAGNDGAFQGDLPVADGSGTNGGNLLRRLTDVELLPSDLGELRSRAKDIPVVFEWPGNHREPGGKVVWLNGETTFEHYPGKFPMTTAFIEGLRQRDRNTQDEPVRLH